MATTGHIAALEARQIRERDALAGKHQKQHTDLRARHDRERKEELQRHNARGGLDHHGLRDDQQETNRRASEHADLDAAHHHERRALRDRHVKELAEARSRPEGSPASATTYDRQSGRVSGPLGPGALGAARDAVFRHQQEEHARLAAKHERQRKELEARHSAAEGRAGRYDHGRSKGRDLDLRTTEHRHLLEKQLQEAEALRLKHEGENDAVRRRQERQSVERLNLENRHRREA
jgi:hypothetical protein